MRTGQTGVFVEFEGDNWYRRNRSALAQFDPSADPAIQMLRQYGLTPRSVLEIGASNGFRVDAIVQTTSARGVAVEPSSEAIADGRQRYPAVEFVQGAAHSVPLDDAFDLVIANFMFHWVDRALLFRSAAEIDRLVADGGFLLIGDFAPSTRVRVRYHHLPDHEVFTYKQNYAELFAASGLYQEVGVATFGHPGHSPSAVVRESERTAVWLLRKSFHEGYVESILPR
jgi:SAM-dependent methyltransferase